MYVSTANVGFFDSLGDAGVQFIINQTEMTTICCSSDYITRLLNLKEEGKLPTLAQVIAFDGDQGLSSRAHETGINLLNYADVVAEGK